MISNNTGMDSFEVHVPAVVGVYSSTVSWVIPVGILRAKWFNKVSFGGDRVGVHVAPNTITGVLTADTIIGDTVLNVSATVTQHAEVGFFIILNGEDLGRIISIDNAGGTITVNNPTTVITTAGSYVRQTIKLVPSIYLDAVDSMMVIEGGEELMIVPANTPLVMYYTNNNGAEKDYSVKIEYKY